MSFKGFINTNRLRFFFITILSILSGISGIPAGYIQMYWLTYIKENNWTEVAITTGLMALCCFFAQSVIYFVQYLNNIQEEEYFKNLRDQIAEHYFEDRKSHKVSDFQSRLTNDFEIVKNNFFEWYVIVPFYGSMLVASLIALISIHWSIFILSLLIDIISYFLPKLIDKKLEKANVNQVVQQQLLTILNGVGKLLSTIVLLGATGILVEHKVIIFGAILSVQNFDNNVSFGMQTTIQGLTMMRSTKPLMAKISKNVEPMSVQRRLTLKSHILLKLKI